MIAFAEKLQDSRITHYTYAPVGLGWEKGVLDALDDKFAKVLKSHLDGSLEAFFQERVFSIFFENENKTPPQKADNAPLTSYNGFQDPLKVAQGLVSFIRELPLQYSAILPINDSMEEHLAKARMPLKISEQLSIVKGDEISKEITIELSNKEHFEYITRHARREQANIAFDPNRFYFRFRQSGYVSHPDSRLVADMGDEIRAFYGVSIASAVFYSYTSSFRDENPAIILAKGQGADWVLASAINADEDLQKCLSLSITKTARETLEAGSDISDTLSLARQLFSSEDRQRLRTSAIWLLRAYLSDRDMDQILASAIAIEVLLGDREAADRIGLTKLMANRCAYALGSSVSDRQEIADFFVQWYKLRSEIVHSGRMRVSEEERKTVRSGLRLAARLLQHEIKMAA